MNNLQNHWHILYTCNITKITIYKTLLFKENVFQKKKYQKNQDFIKSLNKNLMPHRMLTFLPNYTSPVFNLKGKGDKQRNLLPK